MVWWMCRATEQFGWQWVTDTPASSLLRRHCSVGVGICTGRLTAREERTEEGVQKSKERLQRPVSLSRSAEKILHRMEMLFRAIW